jgi:VanZ family protein
MSTPEPIRPALGNFCQEWWPRLLLAALVVYWLSLFAGTHSPIDPALVGPGNDKALHFSGYAGLAFLFGLVFVVKFNPFQARNVIDRPQRKLFIAWLLLALYGGFDELTQPLFGRMCDFHDWLADLTGIVIGLALAAGLSRCWAIMKR